MEMEEKFKRNYVLGKTLDGKYYIKRIELIPTETILVEDYVKFLKQQKEAEKPKQEKAESLKPIQTVCRKPKPKTTNCTRPRLTYEQLAVLVDSLEERINEAIPLLRQPLSFHKRFNLEQTLMFMQRLKNKLSKILKRVEWNQERPITDLIIKDKLRKTV